MNASNFPLYMDHKDHGATVCYDKGKLEQLEKTGWTIRNPQPGKDPVKVERVVGADTDGDGKIDQVFAAPKTAEPAKKKTGPKPKKK